MGIIKKLLMWRTCYIAQKSENCLLFLAFKGLPPYGPNLAEEECHEEQDRAPSTGVSSDDWLVRNFVCVSAIRLNRRSCSRCWRGRGGIWPCSVPPEQ